MNSFACLSVATPWSFHWGASKVEVLAQRAAERGITALGMADRNGLWGAIPFQRACEEAGVKPLLGVRLVVEGAEVQVLALDESGYAAACRLSTLVQFEHRPLEAPGGLASHSLAEWICAERGHFATLTRNEAVLKRLARERGTRDLFVALRPGYLGQRDLDLAEKLKLPAVAAPQVAFADKGDWERHRLLVAIGANTGISRLEEKDLAPRDAWLQGPKEWTAAYDFAPGAMQRSAELARRADFRIPLDRKLLPRFPLPRGTAGAAELARLCREGSRRRRVHEEPRYAAQLKRELQVIESQGMSDYFLIVADIVAYARSQDIACCGRGSAANSLVSYLLGCTQVDPLRHDLYFDRFMHAGRKDFPDVDLDFAWDERDVVRDYVYRRYGRDRVAMIGTHVTFAARGAVRELAKVMGVPPAEIGPFTRALPGARNGGFDAETIRSHPKAARLPLDAEPWRSIIRQAAALDGFPRHLGIHAGGIVISPGPITDYLPLQHAAKETEDGRMVITQWDMDPVEDAGLLKIDLLGNRGLAVIRDAVAEVKQNLGSPVDFSRIDPTFDSRTCDLLERGDTMGCFYIESPSMRGLLQKLRCRTFNVLVAASSIIRPGISSSGMMGAYIERHHFVRTKGRHDESWYVHPAMKELLHETFGVMAYQEDVLKVGERVAGLSVAEADELRRSMSHKRAYRHLAVYRRQFVEGAVKHGMEREKAEELWRQIESFAGYSFCKAHSASYALVSYRSAYLRAHHPAEFMAAVLRNYGGFYSTFAYMAEARRMGLRLKLPCVNTSAASFSGYFDTVQVGLDEIQGLGAATAEHILQERGRNGLYFSVEEVWLRGRPAPKELEALVRAGALDALPDGLSRPERMRLAALLSRRKRPGDDPQGELFEEDPVRQPPPAPEYTRQRLLAQEAESLGWLVSEHPLALYHDAIRSAGAVPARELQEHINQRVRLIGWQVTQKSVRTKTDQPMLFLSFEDTTALYETVMFPDVYRRLAPWVLTQGPYLLEGMVRDEYGAITVEVRDLKLLEAWEEDKGLQPTYMARSSGRPW